MNSGGRYGLGLESDDDGDEFSECQGDCQDTDPSTHPGAIEVCDGYDNDCDGLVPADEDDADLDGYGFCNGDCNDTNPLEHPGAVDLPGNVIDEDCSGSAICDAAASWGNHGFYVRCVVRQCQTLVGAELVSEQECQGLIQTAVHSNVGKQLRRRQPPPPVEP